MPRTAIRWTCDQCGRPITRGTGYVHVSYTDIHRYEQAVREDKERRAARAATEGLRAWVYTLSDFDDMPSPARWHVHHQACDPNPDSNDYWWPIDRLGTWPGLVEFVAHVSDKTWITATDLSRLLRRVLPNRTAHAA